MAELNTAAKVLEIARGELGATSGAKYVTYYNEITGSNLPLGCAWCACFVTWVMRHAGVPTDSVCDYKGCVTGAEWFAKRGRYRTKASGYTPKPGDVVFYDWGTPEDGEDHTGIVERVESGRIYTIEGNNAGKCARDWWSIWADEVAGYGVPLYNTQEEDMTKEEVIKLVNETVKKLTPEIVKQVIKEQDRERAEKSASNWAVPAIDYVCDNGIMNSAGERGDPQIDRPRDYATREELASVAMKVDMRRNEE